jgi:hypothetical protein
VVPGRLITPSTASSIRESPAVSRASTNATAEGAEPAQTTKAPDWSLCEADPVEPSRSRVMRALGTILQAVAVGRFDARIAGRFELACAAEAHERLASRGVLGKLLLRA